MSSRNNDHAQLFARIRLHGLTKSSDGTPCPIDLQRNISFPMPANRRRVPEIDHIDDDLSALSLAPKYDIEARVCFDPPIDQNQDVPKHSPDSFGFFSVPHTPDGALGDGRSGIVYPVEILSWKQAASEISDQSESQQTPVEPPTLPQLCIKVAKPRYTRNLAREAWFYEQFDKIDLSGLVVPRCYGVFHASNIPEGLTIDIPGYDYYSRANTQVKGKPGLYTASLYEEEYDEETNTLDLIPPKYILDDLEKSHTNSEWTLFRETPEVTTFTILVMDMLGPSIKVEEFPTEWKEEINDIFDHIPLHFSHDDLRLANFLQVPPHLQVPCPMHPNTVPGHRWNITDWESGKFFCTIPANLPRPGTLRSRLYHDYRYRGGAMIPNFTNLAW